MWLMYLLGCFAYETGVDVIMLIENSLQLLIFIYLIFSRTSLDNKGEKRKQKSDFYFNTEIINAFFQIKHENMDNVSDHYLLFTLQV